jgi:predicted nucleic acid-binding protein
LILVDSSVWIDYFRGVVTRETNKLDALLGVQALLTGDIILTEVLQGFTHDRDFDAALRLLASFTVIEIGGRSISVQAARNYRPLRGKGVTVRKTIDTLIATRCIESGYLLLYSDRDFDPFVTHLGLSSA